MKKTVFVLGAGASNEIKMPLGPDLAQQIAKCLHFGYDEVGRLTGNITMANSARRFPNANTHSRAAQVIREGVTLAASIDDFMDTFNGDTAVRNMGKVAITACILDAERSSDFHVDETRQRRINFANYHHNWFVQFMRLAGPGAKDPTTLFDGISFIVFNYDRCLEHFFFHALQARYDLDSNNAKAILEQLEIIHPYGIVGSLPIFGQPGPVAYGAKLERVDLNEISQKIRTYTEEIKDDEPKKSIHKLIQEAGNIVFLGFGFHEQNMRLLQPSKPISADVYATAFGASELRILNVRSQLDALVGSAKRSVTGSINVAPMDCVTLMREYGPTIFRSR